MRNGERKLLGNHIQLSMSNHALKALKEAAEFINNLAMNVVDNIKALIQAIVVEQNHFLEALVF